MEKANHQRRIAIILSAGFVFFLMLCPVLAETQRQGAILIEAQIQTEEGLQALAEDTYSLVKIADRIQGETGKEDYQIADAFVSYDRNWTQLRASEMRDAANVLAQAAAKLQMYTASVTTNLQGNACFSELPAGLYLIDRTDASIQNRAYQCSPVLVFLPYPFQGKELWEVNVQLKFEHQPSSPVAPEGPISKWSGKVPGTGTGVFDTLVCLAAGSGVVLIGLLELRRRLKGKTATEDDKQ